VEVGCGGRLRRRMGRLTSGDHSCCEASDTGPSWNSRPWLPGFGDARCGLSVLVPSSCFRTADHGAGKDGNRQAAELWTGNSPLSTHQDVIRHVYLAENGPLHRHKAMSAPDASGSVMPKAPNVGRSSQTKFGFMYIMCITVSYPTDTPRAPECPVAQHVRRNQAGNRRRRAGDD
jgi:hypothetical protein